jgi:hypothetical protein
MPDVSGRSEHACNCVLNEAEAAASRGGGHPAMDLSACASVEDSAWDEPGYLECSVGSSGSLMPAGCARVGISPPTRSARTANVSGIAAWLSSVRLGVAADRIGSIHEESTPHKAATGGGTPV